MAQKVDVHPERFGEMLRRHRAGAGLSQEALSARSGISVDAISLLERGGRRVPRNSTVARLAEALRLRSEDREVFVAAAQTLPSTTRGRPTRPHQAKSGIPHELPRSPADFTGRVAELSRLKELLDVGPNDGRMAGIVIGRRRRPVVISAIDGMGGIGKSALAIHVAQELADEGAYPDGQLYVNLQGATVGLPPLVPLDALGRMLRSLGMDPAAIPGNVEEAAARWRSLTADRQMLVLLDNALSADQVRPLLPGSRKCALLVTSRQVLATLEGTFTMHLDVLPQAQALELLSRIVEEERIAAEQEAAADLIRLCGRLPLAIRIAGARLSARPQLAIRELAEQLAGANCLEALQAGELAVRASFELSVRAMRESPEEVDRTAAAAFGLLSLPDGPNVGAATAASLLGLPESDARVLLGRLVEAQLLENPRPDRYQFHDLMRLYARADAAQWHTGPERKAALTRTIGFYTATAWHAYTCFLRPGTLPPPTADPQWLRGGLTFADISEALTWLETERANLLAAIPQAVRVAAEGNSASLAKLPSMLARGLLAFLDVRAYWLDMVQANEIVLEFARGIEDQDAQADALNDLGLAFMLLGRYADAIGANKECLSICRDVDYREGQRDALNNLGIVYEHLGQFAEAIDCHQEALRLCRDLRSREELALGLHNLSTAYMRSERYSEAIASLRESLAAFQELDHHLGQAASSCNLGLAYRQLARYGEADACLLSSLRLFRKLHHRHGEAESLNELGIIKRDLGHHSGAIAQHTEALTIVRQVGDKRLEAFVLRDLGDTLQAAGRGRQARGVWRESLEICKVLQLPEVDEVGARLAGAVGSKRSRRVHAARPLARRWS